MRRLLGRLVVTFVAALATGTGAATPPLCGTAPSPPATYEHVVWIFFENHGFGQIVHAGGARFMNRLARQCGLATDYRTLAHPSLPNYIAATSGLPLDALGPLRDDCNATGACHTDADNIFAQAPSWKAYAESMRKPCTHWFTGPYAASHNPAVYYRGLAAACPTQDVGLRALQADLDADTLPAFAFVTPNMCHSMHDCAVSAGDRWLARWIGRLAGSAAYQRGTMAIFVTFDESDDGGDGRIATFAVAPSVPPGTRSNRPLDHYALLRTTEEMLGIGRFLGRAAHAPSMRADFHL